MILINNSNLREFQQFSHHLADSLVLVNVLLSFLLQLPFKLKFISCPPGQTNLYMKSSMMSVPTEFPSAGAGFPLLLCLYLSCLFLCSLSIPGCVEVVQSPSSSSEEIVLYVGADSGCMWDKVNSGSVYTTIMDPSFSRLTDCILSHVQSIINKLIKGIFHLCYSVF